MWTAAGVEPMPGFRRVFLALGQTRGSVSYTFWMMWDQRIFNSLETSGGGASMTLVGSQKGDSNESN